MLDCRYFMQSNQFRDYEMTIYVHEPITYRTRDYSYSLYEGNKCKDYYDNVQYRL